MDHMTESDVNALCFLAMMIWAMGVIALAGICLKLDAIHEELKKGKERENGL